MYRFLIADDEAMIRQGIRCLLDYEALGFSLCGEAATGEQTLKMLLELQPDVALVDIRMPGISGLEAVKQARKAGFRGKAIIVSSFSEFRYAQEAIRSGVDNYITKPIDEDELEQIFRSIRTELDSTPALTKPVTLEAILLGHPEASNILPQDRYQVLAWQPFSPDSASDEFRIPGLSKEQFEAGTVGDCGVILLKGEAAISHFREVSQRADSRFLAPYFVGASTETHAQGVADAYASADAVLRRRFFYTKDTHVVFSPPDSNRANSSVPSDCLAQFTEKFLGYIQTFNRKLTNDTLEELRSILCEGSQSPQQVRLFLTDLYLQIKEGMNSRYCAGTIPFLSNSAIIRQITDASCLDDILQFLAERFDMIMSSTGTSTRDSVLDDVLHYIHHNYTTNITLENIAPLFGYNHSYLGKIFRKKLDCSFNSYVDHVRIEKAKELLLQDDAKVYAIAEKVGYKNVDYFHVKFRKYVNQSPAEFRKANRK